MVKVQHILSGQIKDMPPRMAEVVVRLKKFRYYETRDMVVESSAPPVVPVPVAVEPIAPADPPEKFVFIPAETAISEATVLVLSDSVPVSAAGYASGSGAEGAGPDAEPKPKRRYKRRDMAASES